MDDVRVRRFMKDVQKQSEGSKTEQITFRVSEDEVKFFDLVIQHGGIPSFNRLCDFAIRKTLERIESGTDLLAEEFKSQLLLWKPPTPTPKQKNIRLTAHVANRLQQTANTLYLGWRVPTMLRFILLFEGRVILQAPSFAASREQLRQAHAAQLAEQAQRAAEARKRAAAVVPVTGYYDAAGEDEEES